MSVLECLVSSFWRGLWNSLDALIVWCTYIRHERELTRYMAFFICTGAYQCIFHKFFESCLGNARYCFTWPRQWKIFLSYFLWIMSSHKPWLNMQLFYVKLNQINKIKKKQTMKLLSFCISLLSLTRGRRGHKCLKWRAFLIKIVSVNLNCQYSCTCI